MSQSRAIKRTSRRTVLRGGTALGAGTALFLAGCGGGGDSTSGSAQSATATPHAAQGTTTATAKRGGTVRYPNVGAPSNLDLYAQTTGAPLYHVGPVYSGLIGRRLDNNLNLTLEPDLAKSWQQVDDTTLIFTLRPGVKWQNVAPTNGRALKGDDFKFSFQRQVTGTPRGRLSEFTVVDKVETPDDTTVKITLKTPVAEFLRWMADPYNVILPSEVDDEFLKTKAAGTGPFILESYRSGTGSSLVRNPDYFVTGQPYLDKIQVDILPDAQTMLTSFRGGNYDVSASSSGSYLTKPQVDQVKSSIPQALFYRVPNVNLSHIRFNLEKAPFNDARVRQAVDLVQDDNTWVQALAFGDGQRTPPIPAALGKWALPLSELPKRPDVAAATKLASSAGISSSSPVEVNNVMLGSPPSAASTQGAAILEAALKPLGINIKTTFLDTAGWVDALTKKNFDMNLITGVLGFTEPGTYVETYYWDKGGRGYTKHNNANLNSMIEKQRSTLDESTRMQLIQDIQREVVKNAYYSMLYTDNITIATQPSVRDFRLDFLHGGNLRYWGELWLDK